jgi:hypothetical protein
MAGEAELGVVCWDLFVEAKRGVAGPVRMVGRDEAGHGMAGEVCLKL